MESTTRSMQVDDIVRIIDGPWKGHRGIVMVIPEGCLHFVLVAIEREAPRGRHGERGTSTTFLTYAVLREHIAAYDVDKS